MAGEVGKALGARVGRSRLRQLTIALTAGLALFAATAPAANALPPNFIGLQWTGDYKNFQTAAEMDEVQRSGAKVLRLQLDIGQKQANWEPYDSIFGLAAERGMTILPYLYDGSFPTETAPGSWDNGAWNKWVEEAVNRYGYNGDFWNPAKNPSAPKNTLPPTAWEVWNEPNFGVNGVNAVNANPQKYVAFLKSTAEQIRALQTPDPKILLGGLYWNAQTGSDGAGHFNYSGHEFLSSVDFYKGDPYFDGLSLHPYAFAGDRVQRVKDFITEAHNDLDKFFPGEGKKIWVTEVGWPLEYGDAGHPQVTEEEQAAFLTNLLNWMKAENEKLGINAVQWYSYRDIGVANWAYHSGLRRQGGQFRAAWWAYLAQTGMPAWPYAQSATSMTREVVQTLNGQPGWVSVGGEVKPATGGPINEGWAQLDFYKKEGGNWVLKSTAFAPVSNNHFLVENWSVGKGEWTVKGLFREQGSFLKSETSGTPTFTIKDGYQLIARHSEKCLDVSNGSTANSVPLVQWECGNPATSQNQVFKLVPQGNGYYQIVARHSNRCVDVYGASTADSAQVDQYDCIGAANQIWQGVNVSGEWGNFKAKHSGKCLDVYGGSGSNGAAIDQYACLPGALNQQWRLKSVESAQIPTQTFVTFKENEKLHGEPGFVSVDGNVLAGGYAIPNGTKVNVNFQKEVAAGQWETKSTAQPTLENGYYRVDNWGVNPGRWRVRTVFNGSGELAGSNSNYHEFEIKSGYRFVFRHSGKCMTISGNSSANSAPIIQWPCNGSPNTNDGQVFSFYPRGGGYYDIRFNSSDKCLDIYGANPADNGLVDQYDCIGANNQLWLLVPISGSPGWYSLQVKHSGKCIDVPGGNGANGVQLDQWTCVWAPHQQGTFQAIN